MHTLFPPLQVERDDGDPPTSDQEDDADDGVLSSELKENFEAVRATIRAQHRLKQQEESSVGNAELSDGAGKPGEKKRSLEHTSATTEIERLEGEKADLAVATAQAVEREIARMANGVAELEAMLLAQQNAGSVEANNGYLDAVVFPTLPSVIPDEPDDIVQQSSGSSQLHGSDELEPADKGPRKV